jgi:hypothetical protein
MLMRNMLGRNNIRHFLSTNGFFIIVIIIIIIIIIINNIICITFIISNPQNVVLKQLFVVGDNIDFFIYLLLSVLFL